LTFSMWRLWSKKVKRASKGRSSSRWRAAAVATLLAAIFALSGGAALTATARPSASGPQAGAAKKKHKKHHAKKCHGTCKKKKTPPPTPPPMQDECSGTVADGAEGDEEVIDPCTNPPGKLTKFTVSANKGPVTNSLPPAGFTCNVPPVQSDGTMTCTAGTPVDATTKLHFAIMVSGGVGRCPGLTLTVTDTFASGAPVTFKVSC
jgi:hypothetical protein